MSLDFNQTPVAARNLGKDILAPGGRLVILDGLDLQVEAGQAVAILGASGSGKSTLLGVLAGLDQASRGEVRLLGHSLAPLDEDARAGLRAGRVGFVFQSFQLLPNLTALENVLLPLELRDSPNPDATARAALDQVGLAGRADHYPRQLSGGEQQRVAIARAFATRPALLFADEPTGNLDARTGDQVIDLLLRLRQELGTTLVLATHDLGLTRRCDRRLLLELGRLEEQP